MSRINITGWNRGANTVMAIKAIRELAGLPLDESLSIVNRVLRGERMGIELVDRESADMLRGQLIAVGLTVEHESLSVQPRLSVPSTSTAEPIAGRH